MSENKLPCRYPGCADPECIYGPHKQWEYANPAPERIFLQLGPLFADPRNDGTPLCLLGRFARSVPSDVEYVRADRAPSPAVREALDPKPFMEWMRDPPQKHVNSACMSYRHDFGLMDSQEQRTLISAAKRWLYAWAKEMLEPPVGPFAALSGSAPAAPDREQVIRHMVSRFLSWRLPATFAPDGGIRFEGGQPIGTNLLTADEAEAMIRHLLEGAPVPAAPTYDAARDDDVTIPRSLLIDLRDYAAEFDAVSEKGKKDLEEAVTLATEFIRASRRIEAGKAVTP